MNRNDPLVKGETFGEAFQYHLLDVGGPPMIHVTYNRLPEVVVFGRHQRLLSPLAINAGNDIMITSFGGDQVAVSKYTVADGDQKAHRFHQGGRRDPRGGGSGRRRMPT